MSKKFRIGLKYCGGCTPRYDRVQVVTSIKKLLVDSVEVVSYEDMDIDGILVVTGCPTACVDLIPFERYPVWVVTSRRNINNIIRTIKSSLMY